MSFAENPHLRIEPVLAGAPLPEARSAAVLIHGRDQDEQAMLDVVAHLQIDGVAFVLPVAAGRSWYPKRYFDPVDYNQPHLDWALDAVQAAIDRVREAGVADERILVGGFSQGACLTAELIARRTARFGGGAVLTGSLLGPPEQRATPGPLHGLPMFFSCARLDEWIALADARATADVFAQAGAEVAFEVSDHAEHRIDEVGVAGLRRLLGAVAG